MSKQLDAEFQAHVTANDNALILQSVALVRSELQGLKDANAPRDAQLECFKRLVTLYGTLNTNTALIKAA
jgi:hypothetical protein